MKVCRIPFEKIEIFDDGEVYSCCPWHVHFNTLGNLNNNSFEEIWNSEKAVDFRNRILKGDYSLCNLDLCDSHRDSNNLFDPEDTCYEPKMDLYPQKVTFCHDIECNVRCTICRDDIFRNSKEERNLKDSKIESVYLPLLKDAKLVTIGGAGDVFASQHSQKLLSMIAKTYTEVKFNILTNATLCNERFLKELGIIDRINGVFISPHSVTKKTYDKIVRGGNFENVVKNIEMFSKMKKSGKIADLYLIFVVHSVNYHEMPAFVDFADKNNAIPVFWEYRKSGSNMTDNYDEVAIFEPTHKDHHKLLEVLKHKNFDRENDPLHPLLRNLVKNNRSEFD